MKSNYLIALPVLAVVFISGCTNGGPTGGPGVIISGFTPEISPVHSEEQVSLLLQVQNQGESRARNVQAELTNIDPNEWGVGFQRTVQLGDLIARDQVSNTQGETKQVQFQNLRAPILSKGISFGYEPIVRVTYDYSTSAHKPITIVDRDELIRIQQQGQTLPSQQTTYTAGPLAVEITMGNYVPSVSSFGSGRAFDIFPVNVKITNTLWEEGGRPTSRGLFGSQFNYPVRVRIDPPAGTNFVFSGFGDDCSSSQFTVDLFRGKEIEITCELQVTNAPSIRTEDLLKVDLDYSFYTDKSTKLTVQGTRELGTGFF